MSRVLRRPLTLLLSVAALLTLVAPASPAGAAPTCQTDCLRVYSIKMYDYLAADVQANVQVVDENNGLARGAVVHGEWTLPDGSTVDRYDIIGTRGRAEFPLSSNQSGTFTFTVLGITLAGHTFDPAGSALLSNSIDIVGDPPPAGCTVACASVSAIDFSEKSRVVKARLTIEDETGARLPGATVTATWTRPDGTTVAKTATANKWGRARLKVRKTGAGQYTIVVDDIVADGFTYDPEGGITTASYTVG
jgi:hypothetical protein